MAMSSQGRAAVAESENNNGEADPGSTSVALSEEELKALEAELVPADKLLAPLDDYRALSAIVGKPIKWLVQSGLDPYKCSVTVERRAPAVYRGLRVKCGILRAYSCAWPFDLAKLTERLEEEQGGEEYVFIVKHAGKPLWSDVIGIDAPPKLDVENSLLPPGKSVADESSQDDLDKEASRETKMTKVLEARRRRLQAQKEVEGEMPPDPNERPPETEPEPAYDPTPQRLMTPEEVEVLIREREDKSNLRRQLEDNRREMERIRAEITTARQGGGTTETLIQAMQNSTAAMMEGLKMVVANVADQLKSTQAAGQTQFENMVKMMAMSSESQAKLAQAQIDARSRETELLVKMAEGKQEMGMMTADKQMDLLKEGMAFAREMQTPPAADEDLGWANKAGSKLVDLITGKLVTGGANALTAPTPSPAQGASELTEEQIETAAQRIARRVAEKVRNRGAAGPPPEASATPVAQPAARNDIGGFVRAAWGQFGKELETLPSQSAFTKMVAEGPPLFLAGIGRAEKIQEVIGLVAPHVEADQIGQVASKLLDPDIQQWVLNQITVLKAIYARRVAQQRTAAQARATPPTTTQPAPTAQPPAVTVPLTEGGPNGS